MKLLLYIFAFASLLQVQAFSAETPAQYPASGPNYRMFPNEQPPLVPMPREITWDKKARPVQSVVINYPSPQSTKYPEQMSFIISELSKFLKAHEVTVAKEAPFRIDFKIVKSLPQDMLEKIGDDKLAEEAYELKAVSKGVLITATSTKGLYYGFQTLQQLMLRRDNQTTVALCSIRDWPEFQVRGFMNDVGRNFMPLDLITKELDSMANLKMNVYHFHMTDNHGWRLETKAYPQLNDPKYFDRLYGIYTQKEFKQLVEYCRLRNIMVIPEMDMPGHSAMFRKALNLEKMSDPKATEALVKLIKELCALVPADKMPIIHIGTDEARGEAEQVNDDILRQYFGAVEECGRKPMRWHPGLSPKNYNGAIQQLWSGRQARHAWPWDGAEYIDSLETYLNHIDPFETAMTMYFRRHCPFQNAKGLGMILCSWPDLEIKDPKNQLLQTPVFSGMAFVSEPLWTNPHGKYEGYPNDDEYMKYFSNLPPQGDPLLEGFAEYENRVLAIRDRFFVNKEFNYVRQANIPWKVIGPFPHNGQTQTVFPPEEEILKTGKPAPGYSYDGQEYKWSDDTYTGATIIFKHYCDFPTIFNGGKMGAHAGKNSTFYAMTYIYSPKNQEVPFWISGHTWATSDWRNGPASVPGKWFHADPKFWVNGSEIEPPKWEKPNNGGVLVDENYHFRKPTMVKLKQGWNTVLVKSPNNNSSRRWMFTFVPVQVNPKTFGCNVKEYPGLKFSVNPGN